MKPNALRTIYVGNKDDAEPINRYRKLTRAYGVRGAYTLQNHARDLDFPDGAFVWQLEKDGALVWQFQEYVAEGIQQVKRIHRLGRTVSESLIAMDKLNDALTLEKR